MTARVATYHRVSTLDQNPALAPRKLRAAAGRLGRLVLEVGEVGSGARNDRPGWQAAGVRFTVVTQGLDIRPAGDSMSRLLLTMLAGVAEFEAATPTDRGRSVSRLASGRGERWDATMT